MQLILRELRANLKSFIIWTLCIIFFIAMMMSEFSAFYNNPEMANMLDSMPETLMKAFSMSGTNLMTLSGFVGLASVYFYILVAIYSGLMGAGIISKEERDKTAEFFLTLPISRYTVITGKLIATIIYSLALNLVLIASIYITAIPYDRQADFNKIMLLMSISMFLTQMIFMALGLCLSAIIKRYRQSSKITMAILFTLYMASVFVSLSDKMDFLKYITPFKYFDTRLIITNVELEMQFVILSLVIIAAGIAGTYWFYPKRDLHI